MISEKMARVDMTRNDYENLHQEFDSNRSIFGEDWYIYIEEILDNMIRLGLTGEDYRKFGNGWYFFIYFPPGKAYKLPARRGGKSRKSRKGRKSRKNRK